MLQFGSQILSIDQKGEEKKIQKGHHFKSIVLFKTTKKSYGTLL